MIWIAIGCALAALTGALAGSILMLQPYMGSKPMLKDSGGWLRGPGQPGQHFVEEMLLGLIDKISSRHFRAGSSSPLASLIIIILMLLLRPTGVFGHE